MALVADPVKISVQVVDTGGNTSRKVYPTNLAVVAGSIAAIETARDNLVTALEDVTEAVVLKTGILIGETEDTALFGAGEIENQANIVVNLATQGKKAVMSIPAPVDGIFVGASGPNYNIVDPTDAAVLAYLALFETGGDFTLSDGEQLDDTTPFNYGKRIHKASTKG
jgi:hypothetical protein